MKNLIRWLADRSGVTNEIRIETCKEVGHSMHGHHYWFTHRVDVANALLLYAKYLKLGHISPGGHMYALRDRLLASSERIKPEDI